MKVLIASTPAAGHLNPLLAIGRILIAEGHEIVGLSGSALRERIESIGAKFRPLPAGADFRDIVVPELKNMPPGLEWLRLAMERFLVDTIPAQHKGLEQVLRDFAADVIIGDDMFFGVLPKLLGPRSKRPPIVLCGTSILHCRREDGAPHFLGLPPATTQAQLREYAAISEEHDRVLNQPVARRLNPCLKDFSVGPLSMPLFESVVELADAYMQTTVPSFEFPRRIPPSVHFIGALPITPNLAPLPSWAHELDGSRKVVLVTQGTLANHNFGLLIAPTLVALANEPDLLFVVTAGGRPIDAIPGPISDKDGLRRAKSLTSAVWLAPTFPPPPQSVSRRKMKRQNVDAQKAALEPPSFGVHYTRVNELYDSLCLAPRIVDNRDPLANSRFHRRPRPASPERYPLLTSAG